MAGQNQVKLLHIFIWLNTKHYAMKENFKKIVNDSGMALELKMEF